MMVLSVKGLEKLALVWYLGTARGELAYGVGGEIKVDSALVATALACKEGSSWQ